MTPEQMTAVESRVTNQGKSALIAYLLWFFFPLLGAHRFYMGRMGTGLAMLILTLTAFGAIISLIWWFVDAFLIPGWVDENHAAVRAEAEAELGK